MTSHGRTANICPEYLALCPTNSNSHIDPLESFLVIFW